MLILAGLYLVSAVSGDAPDQPESISLEVSGDFEDVYVDGDEVSEGVYEDLDYPYISTDDRLGIVSYDDFNRIEYTENNLRVEQSSGSFLVPYTSNVREGIEEQEDSVTDRSFLDQLSPSFSLGSDSDPSVSVVYDPSYILESEISARDAVQSITVENKGVEGEEVLIEMRSR